jgi:hypothetical protein
MITRDQKRKLHDMDDAELDKLGLTKDEFQTLIESRDWVKVVEAHRLFIQSIKSLVRGKIVTAAPAMKGQAQFSFTVNYDQPIEEARKAGNYDWENSDITSKNYPTSRKGTADIVLHIEHFDRQISSETVIAELDKKGLRPAETHELLALGATYPELQREFPIIALGSVWQDRDGGRSVPCLDRGGSKRGLDLDWFDGKWRADYRFAAIPK